MSMNMSMGLNMSMSMRYFLVSAGNFVSSYISFGQYL